MKRAATKTAASTKTTTKPTPTPTPKKRARTARPAAAAAEKNTGATAKVRTELTAARPRPPRALRDRREALDTAVMAQIRELEAQLDRLIDEASHRDLPAEVDDDLEAVDDLESEASTAEAPDGDAAAGDDVSVALHDFDAEATVVMAPSPSGASSSDERRPTVEVHAALLEETPSQGTASTLGDFRPSALSSELRQSSAQLGVPTPPDSVFDTARELLSTDFYLRKWGRLAMRGRSEAVDDFGFDPIYDAKLEPALDFLYDTYFRVETTDIANVPSSGRCLLVANHSGTLPLDGVMIKHAVKREHAEPRDVRWLTEDFIYHMPFLGSAMNRLGAVRACQENAERLLAKEQLVAVFPEGVKGIGKLFAERYRLQRFGRGGFIKLCLRTGTPIVPVAVVGAEETNPLLFKIEHLSKALGVPYVPVTPTFPALGPLGLLPAPTKWRIQFGAPLDLSGHGPEAAEDEILVGKLAERVRATIQSMLDRAVGTRKSVFFG
jgi:1-acyl-sn-glycerol-3-phosphate acyltransferase